MRAVTRNRRSTGVGSGAGVGWWWADKVARVVDATGVGSVSEQPTGDERPVLWPGAGGGPPSGEDRPDRGSPPGRRPGAPAPAPGGAPGAGTGAAGPGGAAQPGSGA